MIAAVDNETGYVTIAPDPIAYELHATVRGLIMDVLPYEGVRIETPAAQVYGAFGFGIERSGVLRLLVTDPSEMIRPEMVDARSAYAIIIGGSGITAAALRRAAQEQVRGVIVGGIDEAELRAFLGWSSTDCWRTSPGSWHFLAGPASQQPDLTLVVTEGFGSHAMCSPLFELLASHDRQEALIEGRTRLRSPLLRPRVVIPLSSRTPGVQLESPHLMLSPGSTVRLLDHDHFGHVGQVRSSTLTRRLVSRVRTTTVEVQLDNGTIVLLPSSAIEVLS